MAVTSCPSHSQAVFLYCCPDCSSCLAYFNSIGWAALAIWAATKKYRLLVFIAAQIAKVARLISTALAGQLRQAGHQQKNTISHKPLTHSRYA